jgi:hypothetical protein
LLLKPEEKCLLGRPRRRWVDNISLDLCGEKVYRLFVGKTDGKKHWGDLG